MKTQLCIFLLVLSLSGTQATEKITRFDLIKFERTPCFGICPAYKIAIWPDGRVQYFRVNSAKSPRLAKIDISVKKIEKLIEAFNDINFFDLRDEYRHYDDGCTSVSGESSSAIISIKIGDREKTVNHSQGCRDERKEVFPSSLVQFENKIDEIVGTSRWVGKD